VQALSIAATPASFPAGFTIPGWHIRGRQAGVDLTTARPGTFESTFGRSPMDYHFVQVLRFANGNYSSFQFSGTGNNAKWSPEAPVLDNGDGEAAFFNLGPETGITNPNYTSTGSSGFTFTGVTPSEDVVGSSASIPFRIVGSGLGIGYEARLRQMTSTPKQTVWTAATAEDADGYFMDLSMPLLDTAGTALPKGDYQVQVRKIGTTGATKTLDYAFHLKPVSNLKLTLTGPTLANVSTANGPYTLRVEHVGPPGSQPISQVRLSGIMPNLMPLSLVTYDKGNLLSPTFVGHNPLVPVYTFQQKVNLAVTLNPGEWYSYTFFLTPGAALLTTPIPTTVDIIGKIISPSTDQDQVRLPITVIP
jgi:hypothetical protein